MIVTKQMPSWQEQYREDLKSSNQLDKLQSTGACHWNYWNYIGLPCSCILKDASDSGTTD